MILLGRNDNKIHTHLDSKNPFYLKPEWVMKMEFNRLLGGYEENR